MTEIQNAYGQEQLPNEPEELLERLIEANKDMARQYLEKASNLTSVKNSIDWDKLNKEQKDAWMGILTN